MFILCGCTSVTHRAGMSGFYRANIEAPDAEVRLLWLHGDGRFKVIHLPETEWTADGSFRLGGGEDGHWRISGGRVKMRTDSRTWAPHPPKTTSFAEIKGQTLKWRGATFIREEAERQPNQALQTTPMTRSEI